MTAILMAVLGILVGYVLDDVASRLARKPFEHGDANEDEDDDETAESPHRRLDLASETGEVALPWSLTGGTLYRRILIVTVTGILFALVGQQYEGHVPAMLVVAGYVSVLLVCATTDIIAYRVPNVISYPAILGALLLGMLWPGADRVSVAGGGLLAGGLFLGCAMLPGGPMGLGDVKLALFMGFALGFTGAVQAMLVMALTGGAIASALLVMKLVGRRENNSMFYAPFIAAGAIFALLVTGAAIHPLT